MGRVKWKSASDHAQIQIVMHTLKVSSRPLLSIDTFYSI